MMTLFGKDNHYSIIVAPRCGSTSMMQYFSPALDRNKHSLKTCLDAPNPIIVLRKPADRSKSGSVMAVQIIRNVMNNTATIVKEIAKSVKVSHTSKDLMCRALIEEHCGPWLVPNIGPYINPVEPWMKWEFTKQYDLLSKLRYIRFEELDEYISSTKHGFSVDYSIEMPVIHYNEIHGWDQTISPHDLYLEEELYAYIILHAKKISPAEWLKLKK